MCPSSPVQHAKDVQCKSETRFPFLCVLTQKQSQLAPVYKADSQRELQDSQRWRPHLNPNLQRLNKGCQGDKTTWASQPGHHQALFTIDMGSR